VAKTALAHDLRTSTPANDGFDTSEPFDFYGALPSEFFAFCRQRRREYRRAKAMMLASVYGETRRYGGPWVAWSQLDGTPPLAQVKGQPRKRERERIRAKIAGQVERKQTRIRHRASTRPHQNYITRAMFEMLRRLQGDACYICSEPFTTEDGPTQDHVIPRAKGGGHAGNVLLAHLACNNAKGDRDPTPAELGALARIKRAYMEERLEAETPMISTTPAKPGWRLWAERMRGILRRYARP
jgi:5-methylcytosine-specific restriction endonuclease McrA